MRHEPTTDELPIQQTVELPDGRKTVEIPGAQPQHAPTDSPGSKPAEQPTGHLPAGDTPEDRTLSAASRGLDYSDAQTTSLPSNHGGRHRPETIQQRQTGPAPNRSGFWRELTGALAAGTVLLAAAVLILQTIAWLNGMPGLGVFVLVGHLVGAALAVVAQRVADRRTGKPALVAGLGVGAVVVLILVLFWWI
jgi:hypothetical protein